VEARDNIIKAGKLGKVGLVEMYCYTRQRRRNPPDTQPPPHLDYEMWTGPAPMRPYNEMVHPGSWRSFMEYGNGLIGDMCIHMLDMVRWMLDLGSPTRIASTGGILVNKGGKANISDTQTATWDFDDLRLVWQHRAYGHPPDPKYWWGANFYGDTGTLKATVFGYEYTPIDKNGQVVQREVTYELEQYPEDKTEPRLEKHVAPAIRYHMKNFLAAIDSGGKPVADIEQGYISTASCILANLAMKTGRTLVWNAAKGRIEGDEDANRLLRRTYRQPWVHPEPDRL
jgi:predicted dehydrogenase